MLLSEIMEPDSETKALLLKLHKGAGASLTAKKTEIVLNLLGGWTMEKMAMLKPTDWVRDSFDKLVAGRDDFFLPQANRQSDDPTRLHVMSFHEDEAMRLYKNVAKFEVASLPDPKKAKPTDYFVMNLTVPTAKEVKDQFGSNRDKMVTRWVWSFDLYRKGSGYRITSPDGQTFDVIGPVQTFGFGGTHDFGAFFKWALEHTDIAQGIADLLGMPLHVKASERPRIPVGGQVLGHCAICNSLQVVRHDKMVAHGYTRPGHGYIEGPCFGVGYNPYEISAKACEAYIPVLKDYRATAAKRLARLKAGVNLTFYKVERDWRRGTETKVPVVMGHKDYEKMLAGAIGEQQQTIAQIDKDIPYYQKKIADWKPGTLKKNG